MSKTIDKTIAELEQDVVHHASCADAHRIGAEKHQNIVDEVRRRIEELKAQRDAEARKTVGERVAEQMIQRHINTNCWVIVPPDPNPSYVWMPLPDDTDDNDAKFYRRYIAAAIDKAVADEREACAWLAENACGDCDVAKVIRKRK